MAESCAKQPTALQDHDSWAYLEDLCFDAQQAAEKAIKAVLIAVDAPFPPIHDLTRLLTLLEQAGVPISTEVEQAARLTRFAVTTRYPGVTEPVMLEEHQRAVEIAKAVVQWAEALIRDRNEAKTRARSLTNSFEDLTGGRLLISRSHDALKRTLLQ